MNKSLVGSPPQTKKADLHTLSLYFSLPAGGSPLHVVGPLLVVAPGELGQLSMSLTVCDP